MSRSAQLGVGTNITFGIFQLLGKELMPRAARAWQPREIWLMEDASVAFHLVEEQRERGIRVEEIHIQRLVHVLVRYFRYIGQPRSPREVNDLVQQYLREHSVEETVEASEFDRFRVDHGLFDELKQLDDELRERFPKAACDPGLGSLGLILGDSWDDMRYGHCTPLNVRTFAHTGGDGVHFSLMLLDGGITPESPVVVTRPAAFGEQNLVVGSNLYEFLSFGCLRGFFAMQTLSIDAPEIVQRFIDAHWHATTDVDGYCGFGSDDTKEAMLRELRERFQLTPWPSADRFRELQEKYQPLLKLPPM
jgi:hypothetical protein